MIATVTPTSDERAARPIEPDAAMRPVLNRLRFLAVGCRATERLDLELACTLIVPDRDNPAEAAAIALIRSLDQALGRPAHLLGAGARGVTFDECWVLRLVERAADGDDLSVAFLTRRRVRACHRRTFVFLVRRFANELEQLVTL